MACDRHFNGGTTIHHSRIEKHHHCYLRLCTGTILPDDSKDIYRPVKRAEFDHVPDCRQCQAQSPEYFAGCVKKIFPVHSECHEDIHELERYLFMKLSKKIKTGWEVAA